VLLNEESNSKIVQTNTLNNALVNTDQYQTEKIKESTAGNSLIFTKGKNSEITQEYKLSRTIFNNIGEYLLPSTIEESNTAQMIQNIRESETDISL